jgi:nucleotide-binding universal stress UspA family protein
MEEIVVGLVDSPEGRSAFRFARQLAHDERARLTAVTVFRSPIAFADPTAPMPITPVDLERACAVEQAHVLAECQRDDPGDVAVRCEIYEGDPATTLCCRADRADLLVVGRRSSRLRRFLSGSVSTACANRCSCSIVIVHDRTQVAWAARSASR